MQHSLHTTCCNTNCTLYAHRNAGRVDEIERVTGDKGITYEPHALLAMLSESDATPDPRVIVNVCDRFFLFEEMASRLHAQGKLRHLALYVNKINPAVTPQVSPPIQPIPFQHLTTPHHYTPTSRFPSPPLLTTTHHTTPLHSTPQHTTPWHTIPYHTTPHHTTQHRTTPQHTPIPTPTPTPHHTTPTGPPYPSPGHPTHRWLPAYSTLAASLRRCPIF